MDRHYKEAWEELTAKDAPFAWSETEIRNHLPEFMILLLQILSTFGKCQLPIRRKRLPDLWD